MPIAVCGEMAGDVRLTRLLLGLGLRDFSMHPAHLLAVKQRVLTSDVADDQADWSTACAAPTTPAKHRGAGRQAQRALTRRARGRSAIAADGQ